MYNNLPSELFDLIIMNFETGQTSGTPMVESQIDGDLVNRNLVQLHYATTYDTPIEFDITVGRNMPITNIGLNNIVRWLVGTQKYLPFQIVQDDMLDTILYTIFTSATPNYFGNVAYSITLHGVCNSPFAFTSMRGTRIDGNQSGEAFRLVDIYNESVHNDYTYPNVEFEVNSNSGIVSIINHSDSYGSEKSFVFSNLLANEKITVDNRNKILTSSLGYSRLPNFSKVWLRLVPGQNNLEIQGSFRSMIIKYTFSKVLGV